MVKTICWRVITCREYCMFLQLYVSVISLYNKFIHPHNTLPVPPTAPSLNLGGGLWREGVECG